MSGRRSAIEKILSAAADDALFSGFHSCLQFCYRPFIFIDGKNVATTYIVPLFDGLFSKIDEELPQK